MIRSVLAGLLLLTVWLAACGRSSADTAVQSGGETTEITIQGFSFGDPATATVGGSVKVTNNDTTTHTWTSRDGVFDSGRLAEQATFEFVFDEPGEYEFFCTIHPSMTGSITVTE